MEEPSEFGGSHRSVEDTTSNTEDNIPIVLIGDRNSPMVRLILSF